MNDDSTGSAGDAPRIARVAVVALYDPTSGLIRHLHMAYVYEGAVDVSDDMAVAQAKRYAGQLGHGVNDLGVAVSANAEHGSRPHRIEVESGRFVQR